MTYISDMLSFDSIGGHNKRPSWSMLGCLYISSFKPCTCTFLWKWKCM